MTDLHQIGMLWMRGSLSFLEQLCVKSFLDAGHHTILYTYEEVGMVPDGVEFRDASDVLPETGFLVHERTGSPALHSDLFRYHMLRDADRMIWADTDAYCRKPFVTKTGHFYGWESKKHINGGVLGLPKDSPTLEGLLNHCSDEFAIPTWYGDDYVQELRDKKAAGNPVHAGEQPWGVWGPHAVSHFLHETGEDRYAFAQDGLYPYTFKDRRKIVKPNNKISDYVTDNTFSVHLYGRRMRKFLAEHYKGVPDPTGLLGQLLIKHKVNPLDAPLRDYPNPDRDSAFAKVFREEIDGKQYQAATPTAKPTPVPVQAATPKLTSDAAPLNSVVGVTTMKNEGPYILDWVAYHMWLGFTHFLVYTNDCSDGTDEILDRLERRGLVTRIDNPANIDAGERPQRIALAMAQEHPVIQAADAYMVFDVDEYINIHTPEGTIRSLMDATGNPELIAMTWRFFGCSGVTEFADVPVPMQFANCAPQLVRVPHHNWGFKTFARFPSTYSKFGIHRPLKPTSKTMPHWVNGSGDPMPDRYLEDGWRSSLESWGYGLVTLNHYSIRSLDSYLVKRDRGRTNHINREQGVEYWNVHNRNDQEDRSIEVNFEKAQTIRGMLFADPILSELHEASCNWHRERVNMLKSKDDYNALYQMLAQEPMSHAVIEDDSIGARVLPDLALTGAAFDNGKPIVTAKPFQPEPPKPAKNQGGKTAAQKNKNADPILLGADAQEAYDSIRERVERQFPHLDPIAPLSRDKITIVTTVRNEAPFLIEWIAYHRSIGVTDFLIYTNDCTDETVALLDRLQMLGYVTRLDNPFKVDKGQKPQRGALNHAVDHPLITESDWHICMDCDEFINVHVGTGTLSELFTEMNEPNVVSMTWKFFGNGGINDYEDRWVSEQFTRCAPQFIPKPRLGWGIKTLVHKSAPYSKLGVHRPLNADEARLSEARWVNGSGRIMPEQMLNSNSWRSTKRTLGYDLVTLNHYVLRSADSYLVKRERGRVNHVDEDMGGYYWDRRNYNTETDDRMHAHQARARAEADKMLADPEVSGLHAAAVQTHKSKVAALKANPDYATLYAKISAPNQPDAIFMLERSEEELTNA
ncbi:glycosyltransferase family 2 protein [Cochlodiniinecator piscidefendens]|uniref:glycosyltransferase family 2 protein n=1 Tax=Cochlodiniinecator piscidefendens TaxID=2715756 RepID=UPI00140909EC|nr:glycosyltransferase family 2 protein [Cochlodiniinecator piscidefendens]